MTNFKNDALTTAEQNNVEGGFFFLKSFWGYGFKKKKSYSYGGHKTSYKSSCYSKCYSSCGSKNYKGW